MTKYQRIVAAALAAKRSTFTLAEALALEIPAATPGSNDGTVTTLIKEAAAEIVAAGGEDYAISTLAKMRMTALWVKAHSDVGTSFGWRTGTSFWAHSEAASGNMDWDLFTNVPRTVQDIRHMTGKKVDGVVEIDQMSAVERTDLMRQLADEDIDSLQAVVIEKQSKEVQAAAERITQEAAKKAKLPTGMDQHSMTRILTLITEIERQARHNVTLTARWERDVEPLWVKMTTEQKERFMEAAGTSLTSFASLIESTHVILG